MKPYKTIGILGGMGPQATAELYLRIIRIFQKEFGAKYDSDFPEMIILNLPIPDVVESTVSNGVVEQMLVDAVVRLEKAGADFVVIPCNTVTYYLTSLRESVSIPVVSIMEEVNLQVKSLGLSKVGLLATQSTILTNIYGKELSCPILTLDAKDRQETTHVILRILEGAHTIADSVIIKDQVRSLLSAGAQRVILGCTELPLVLCNVSEVIDTLQVLASVAVRRAVS